MQELKVSVLGPQYKVIDAKYGPIIKVNLHNLFPSRRLIFTHWRYGFGFVLVGKEKAAKEYEKAYKGGWQWRTYTAASSAFGGINTPSSKA